MVEDFPSSYSNSAIFPPVSFPSTNFLDSIGTHMTVSTNEETQF